ncbi:unnamed protein product [Albugo candida]|uniref:Uncharacterized protein n=1 Tax=Albugo candida TaxID=65357 RepID=A0A024FTS5_9STRA|nr:unnamed protein product [Albugo candida]|eukprot:CCI10347.1 unnamed protein product [Albugo candida]
MAMDLIKLVWCQSIICMVSLISVWTQVYLPTFIPLSMTYCLMRPRAYFVTSSPYEENMEFIRKNTRMMMFIELSSCTRRALVIPVPSRRSIFSVYFCGGKIETMLYGRIEVGTANK